MKAYLWHDIDKVSENYHERGSVLIQAESLERARELSKCCTDKYREGSYSMIGTDAEPDAVFECDSTEEKVWVFPDAGCC